MGHFLMQIHYLWLNLYITSMCVLLCLIFGLCVLWFVNKRYDRMSCYYVYFRLKYYITSCITQLFIELLICSKMSWICMDIQVYIKSLVVITDVVWNMLWTHIQSSSFQDIFWHWKCSVLDKISKDILFVTV